MKISDGEKLILSMLCDLHEHLSVAGEIDPKFVRSAITGGHFWALSRKYVGLFHDHEDSDQALKAVVDTLDMWDFIESAYEELSEADKDRLAIAAEPFGKNVSFLGFDGNYESEHLGIANFLINTMGRFQRFKGRDLNSHMPTVDTYRRMLSLFSPMRVRTLGTSRLSLNNLILLLNAKAHPDLD